MRFFYRRCEQINADYADINHDLSIAALAVAINQAVDLLSKTNFSICKRPESLLLTVASQFQYPHQSPSN